MDPIERNVSIIHLSRLVLRFIGEKERVKLEKFESLPTTFHSSHLPSIKNQTCKCARAISILAKSSMKSVWRISEKRGAREGCANYESNRWRGNGEEVERGRGFIMQSRWLRLQLCFLSSRHRPRENSLVDFAALDTALTTLPTEDTFDEPSRKLIMQGGRDRYPSPRRWLKGTSASCG